MGLGAFRVGLGDVHAPEDLIGLAVIGRHQQVVRAAEFLLQGVLQLIEALGGPAEPLGGPGVGDADSAQVAAGHVAFDLHRAGGTAGRGGAEAKQQG